MAYKNAMKKTGIYQDRENGMLKNHGMLKDLGMMQEEGMRGMRRMRGMHQTDEELRAEMEAAKGPVPEMKSKPQASLNPKPEKKAKGVYSGEPIDISFGGKSMRVSGVESYTKPSGSEGYTVNRPGKGAFGIEVPKGTDQYEAIRKSLKKGYAG